MPNAFGIEHTPISKGVKTGLNMVENAGKLPSRARMFGAKSKKTVDLREKGTKVPAQRTPSPTANMAETS